jgi:hypothetical protein
MREFISNKLWELEQWWIKYNPLLQIPYFRRKEEKWVQQNILDDREKLRKTIRQQRKRKLTKLKLEEKKKNKNK